MVIEKSMTSQKFKFVKLWDRLVYLERTRWKKNPCQKSAFWCKLMGISKIHILRKLAWIARFKICTEFMTTVQLYTGRLYYLEYGCFCKVVPCYNANWLESFSQSHIYTQSQDKQITTTCLTYPLIVIKQFYKPMKTINVKLFMENSRTVSVFVPRLS